MKKIRLITDIEEVKDVTYSYGLDNRNYATLSFGNYVFRKYVFYTSKKGDYIVYKNKRYYYPYTNNIVIR